MWTKGNSCCAQVGNIYQNFSSPEEGRVQNIIQLSVAGLTVPDNGATFTVDATYDVRSDSRIALVFNAASLGERHHRSINRPLQFRPESFEPFTLS